jgi:hypothetical protein
MRVIESTMSRVEEMSGISRLGLDPRPALRDALGGFWGYPQWEGWVNSGKDG